jgi:uncharacterized protein YjbI with pentapeptide repeats
MNEKELTNKNNKVSEQYKTSQVLPKPSEDELNQILENHKIWLESNGNEGEQAYLCSADLRKSNFSGMNLKNALFKWSDLRQSNFENTKLQDAHLEESDLHGAIFWDADLQGAHFDYSNLQRAILWGANLKETGLKNANLKGARLDRAKGLPEAELQYANIEGATGLLGNEFSQADVTGTKLPDDIKDFKALEIVKETSQNARKIFFAMLLGCVYSWLTIGTTTDVRLLTNTASSPLPIIGTEIPIAWFYIAAPLVLIALYLYFHFYLQGLWESLAGLPALFQDGKRLDERAYPWLLNRLVRRHFNLLRDNRPLMAKLQEMVVIVLAWVVVPFTMIGFWLRYIPRHDWWGTGFHIGLIVVSVAFAIIFYRLCALSLQGKEKNYFRWQNFWKDRRFYYGVCVMLVGALFSMLSYGAIEGVRPRMVSKNIAEEDVWEYEKIDLSNFKEIIPWAFKKMGYNVFVDFREKAISEKPANYGIIDKKERLEFVKGANLNGRNLTNADMVKAFLIKANLRGTNLKNANLWLTNLQDADLRLSNLSNADLYHANLENAKLWRANLQNAKLLSANLKKADFTGADIQNANLSLSRLQSANLTRANLQKTEIRSSDFRGTKFYKANLRNSDLSRAKNLTIEQLSKVKTLYKAKIDPDLMEQVKKCCPHLLEEPKEETD